MSKKYNVSLITGIAIPVLMIILVALSILLPGLFAPTPKYDFLYLTGNTSLYRQYTVKRGKLVMNKFRNQNKNYDPGEAKFYVHNVAKNTDKEISFEEAQALTLNSNTRSPDGYEVVYGNNEYGFFPVFFAGGYDRNTMYLKGHNTSKKLELQSRNTGLYNYNRPFLGWLE